MNNIDKILLRLSKSKFRSSFHLNKKMKDYVLNKGMDTIREHAYEIINKRIAPKDIINDGKQTPMRQVHPVFVAEHATATCCRGCINKWYNIPKNRELTADEIQMIVDLICEWINKEMIQK